MGLTTLIQPPFRVSLKAELQTYLSQITDGALIFCDENSAWYVKKNGVIINSTGVNISMNSSTTTSTTSTTDVVVNGMTCTPGKGNYVVSFNARYSILSGNTTGQAAIDYTSAYNAIMSLTVTDATHLSMFGLGETLFAGVYTVTGAGSLSGSLNLDAQGNANAIFVLRFGGAFTVGSMATINLVNGASASNIYIVAEGAISVAASSVLKGCLIAHNGAVSLGASCNLQGRMLTNLGLVSIDTSTISIPTGSIINIGTLINFAMFTSSGNVSNTGASIITGDIGTNAGTISGFGAAVVNGNTYLPGVDNNPIATFSIYQNGVQIPNSIRTRVLNVNTVDIQLESSAIVDLNQAIDIRYKVDAGTILLYNRVLTVKNIQ